MLIKKQQAERVRLGEASALTTAAAVSFSNELRVILVPSRKEYRDSGVHQDLWWQSNDYLAFKYSAEHERSTRAADPNAHPRPSSAILVS
jgi:hypothetical protein